MKYLKKGLSIIIGVLVIVSSLTFLPAQETQAAGGVYNKLMSLKSKFPDGKYWNHIVPASEAGGNCSNEAYADQVTSTPCLSHNSQVGAGNYDCNYFDGGLQCCGFAKKIFYDVFGERESSNSLRRIYSSDGLRVGDYVRFTYEHYAIVLTVSGSTFTVVECNLDQAGASYNCIIRWGRQYPKSEISYYVHSNNYDYIDNGGDTVSVSFSPWENSAYTYITSTDASLGQEITVSGGNCTETGMYLYDNSETFLAEAHNESYTLSKVYFKINEECGYTLKPGTTYKYKFYAIVNGKYYWSAFQSFSAISGGVTVTFSPWENGNYTYIGKTDAGIGQEINVSNGTCTQTGMYLYDAAGNHIATAHQDTYYYRIYFKINEECGYTLTPGTVYKYRFYAVVNGQTYWSDIQSFTTSGPTPAVKPEISWTENYSFPSKYSALLCVRANTSVSGAFSEASIQIWDKNGKLVAEKTENGSTNTTTSLPIWYDVYSETGSLLEPSSQYTYQFHVIVNEYTYQSPVYSFTTETETQKHYGIDVSSHQGVIDWTTASKYIDFAVIRCGFGADYTANDDTQWVNNVTACEQYGIPYGVYLYSYAENEQEALSEAQHVIRLLAGHSPALPVYLDLEDSQTTGGLSAEQILKQAKIFCETIKNAGYDVGIYASKSWWSSKLVSSEYAAYEKWTAIYSGTYAQSASTGDMWQYSSSGKVPGINGNVDVNIRNRNVEQKTHSHTMVKTPGVAATCTKNGNIEYWTCSGCGKYFYEEAGINEITNLQDTIIKAKGHNFSGNAQYCRNGCGTKNPNYQENIPEGNTDISGWKVSGIKDLVYTGDILKQEHVLVFHDGEYATVKVKYRNNVDVGTASVTITGTGEYYGQIVKYFKITKANNPLKTKVSKKTYKQSKLKKVQSFKIGVTKAQGKVTYTLDKKAKKAKIKVTAKGKVTVPKKCKKGTYKITVKAAGNKNYKADTKTVTIKVK